MQKLNLHKTIFQIRYKPELKFFGLLMEAAQKMNEYPHWSTDKLSIILKNYEKHCSLSIKHNTFSYEQDSSDENMEAKFIQDALENLPSALQIKIFNRFGYRRKYIIAVNMPFESVVSVLHIKFFSQDDKLRSIMPLKIEDLMYRIDFMEDPYKYHVTAGPVRKWEIPNYINYNIENHLDPKTREKDYQEVKEKYPEVAVFIDVDFYQASEKLIKNNPTQFIDIARQKVSKMANSLNRYLFEVKLEE